MLAARFDEAIVVLEPVANNPHGGEARDYAAQLIELARAGAAPVPWAPSESGSN